MNQIPLTLAMRDLPLPYKRDSDTSIAAATKARPKAPAYRTAILGYLVGRGALGATNEEISLAMGIKIQTVCPRMKELREAGTVVAAGAWRPTESGRDAVVWVARAAQ